MRSEFTIAVHGLVYLSHKGVSLDSEELAENICTNPARVRKVMAQLKKAGMVATKEGTGGGYLMNKAAEAITLREVADVMNIAFVEAAWKSGDHAMECLVASGMSDLMDGIFMDMNDICMQYLEKLTIESLEKKIFDGRKTK